MLFILLKWVVDVMIEIIKCFSEITRDAYKSAVATATGSVAGYTPEMVSSAQGYRMSCTDQYIQYAVWAVTLIVGIFAIINAIQKQIDRYERKRKKPSTKQADQD